jgi:rfaE bifunctional protein nucleotidyltransferase chain/domain
MTIVPAPEVPASPKIVGWDQLLEVRRRARAEGQAIVWTNGCFDLLHVGHIRNLRAARLLGDLLVVGVNSDSSVRQLKGPHRPIVTSAQRVEILAALACVDYVIVFEEPTAEESLARLQPDIYCKGADYAPPAGKPVPESRIVASYGGKMAFLPLTPASSTTDIVRRIRETEHTHPGEL